MGGGGRTAAELTKRLNCRGAGHGRRQFTAPSNSIASGRASQRTARPGGTQNAGVPKPRPPAHGDVGDAASVRPRGSATTHGTSTRQPHSHGPRTAQHGQGTVPGPLLSDPRGARGGPGLSDPPTHPHIRKFFLRGKMNFIKGAGKLRPISGTQTFFWPLIPPPPGGGGGVSVSATRSTGLRCTAAPPAHSHGIPRATDRTPGGAVAGHVAGVRQVTRDQKELDPTESDTGRSSLLLRSGRDGSGY